MLNKFIHITKIMNNIIAACIYAMHAAILFEFD